MPIQDGAEIGLEIFGKLPGQIDHGHGLIVRRPRRGQREAEQSRRCQQPLAIVGQHDGTIRPFRQGEHGLAVEGFDIERLCQ
ncbi:MAG TPA: hypothetical protein VMG10_31170, partial [Gemmataceae bacterium]|nr:hypothetical protein [Gemmataceae bacterium]